MNKQDLINEVEQVVGTKSQASAAVNCVLQAITATLKIGETVTLAGFGTFRVDNRKARKGRNPQTGQEIEIKARKVPKFSAGKLLKDSVN